MKGYWVGFCALGALYCSANSTSSNVANETAYHQDIAPLFAQKCMSLCHVVDGIAPFSLATYDDVYSHRDAVNFAVTHELMPPWPPSNDCTTYRDNRSLTASEISMIQDWLKQGAPPGTPTPTTSNTNNSVTTSTGFNKRIAMSESYTPRLSPDDYRCFVLDWNEQTVSYVTGFRALPGSASVVHHILTFVIAAKDAAKYANLDAKDDGPGYSCFGGPGGLPSGTLGSWAPGQGIIHYPEGTGIKVEAGAKIIMQVHYNIGHHDAVMDMTAIELNTAPQVDREGFIIPWTNPLWLSGQMTIPALETAVSHSFNDDPTKYFEPIAKIWPGLWPKGPIKNNTAFRMYSANLHMHLLGTHSTLSILRQDSQVDCLLDIPQWDFHWQGDYFFKDYKVFNPGDRLKITCNWDNSAVNQPFIHNQQQTSHDVNWGEGTTDEMCLGGIYITAH